MPIRVYKKNISGRRFSSVDTFEDITKTKPTKSLIRVHKKRTGRSFGTIAVRHRGGGTRPYYRLVDFKQQKYEIPAKVEAIEYDPNRGARIALVRYEDGERSYILAPLNLAVGEKIVSSRSKAEVKIGNRMLLENIPIGMTIHNVELKPGAGGKIIRGAGTSAQLLAIEDKYAVLRLPSGELRRVFKECAATLGQVSNPDRHLIRWGKAGRMRHRGIRPSVRGKAMNPVDHPHGGGEGHNPIGMRRPEDPWGKPALGVKTRKHNKWSNKFIIQKRSK